MKAVYEKISRILDKICYHDYNWKICSDLKVVALLTGLQTQATQNTAASYVNGTVEPETNITSYRNGLAEKRLLPVRKMSFTILWSRRKIFTCRLCTSNSN
ncbi:hypothetical protein AVEN_241506-1 [Araneus ventricosus]|uniref:Uncharacterized protein n=1 Tax=Araneus ventricosus TaxID=182803 RepID=A0A4Y2FK01_ARAVE|nr:hypothetical protein AVEN_241506-1 [Araneus ventricosus]